MSKKESATNTAILDYKKRATSQLCVFATKKVGIFVVFLTLSDEYFLGKVLRFKMAALHYSILYKHSLQRTLRLFKKGSQKKDIAWSTRLNESSRG